MNDHHCSGMPDIRTERLRTNPARVIILLLILLLGLALVVVSAGCASARVDVDKMTLAYRRALCLRLGLDPTWGACLWRRPLAGIYAGMELSL